jgi:hypothetical protein
VPGTARQVRLDVLGPVGVLEDDQPVAVRLTPAQRVADRPEGAVDVAGLGQPQLLGEFDQGGAQPGGLLGRDPPHQVVRVGVPVRVLDGELGAPGATELVLGGGQQHNRTVAQEPTDPVEEFLPAHEPGTARRQAATDRHRRIPSL